MADEQTTGSTSTAAEKPARDRVFLKSGMGSVAVDDYDEKIHGKALELTDDEYHARMLRIIPGITIPMGADLKAAIRAAETPAPIALTTTIANLQVADLTTAPPTIAPVATVGGTQPPGPKTEGSLGPQP